MTHLDPTEGWERLLVIAPHPDDETLAAGGLLQRVISKGGFARIAFLSDGEQNPLAQSALEKRLCIGQLARNRYRDYRRKEAIEALSRLGLSESDATFLGYPDMKLEKIVRAASNPLLDHLTRLLLTFKPTVVLIPSLTDLHPDHRAGARVSREAMRSSGLKVEAFCYSIHRLNSAKGDETMVFRLSDKELAGKKHAIEAYGSQLVLSRKRFSVYAAQSEEFSALAQDHPESNLRQYARPLRRLLLLARPILSSEF